MVSVVLREANSLEVGFDLEIVKAFRRDVNQRSPILKQVLLEVTLEGTALANYGRQQIKRAANV